MITIHTTIHYQKARKKFLKNNPARGHALITALEKFTINPRHSSLNMEKLRGSRVWTVRIDRGSRIFFVWMSVDTALFLDIGKHDMYREY